MVVTCARDRELLVPCVEMLRYAYGDAVRVYVSVDRKAVYDLPPGLEVKGVVYHGWKGVRSGKRRAREMFQALGKVAELSGAEWVMKADVDAVHLSARWLDEVEESRYDFVGFQSPRPLTYCYGLAYVVRAACLEVFDRACVRRVRPGRRAEDVAVSQAVQAADPNRVWSWPCWKGRRHHVGWQGEFREGLLSASVVHCGQKVGGSRKSEIAAVAEVMQELSSRVRREG